MKRQDKECAGRQKIREEVFLHVWLPVITEYVEWVLENAVKSGKKRLYFLARDGYMMYLLAEKLIKAGNLEIEIRYLKVSRYAIRNAEYYFNGKDALETLCAGGIDITFEKIMKRANLTEEEALHIAGLAGRTETYQKALNHRQLHELKKELSRIDRLFFYIKKHAEICYETTAAYLRQEGLLEKIPYALVDSGWVGSLQLSIQRVLMHAASENIRLEGYYFGIYERPKGTGAEQYKAFYFGEKQVRRKVRFSNCLFETVFSAPEGMTCGYAVKPESMKIQSPVYAAWESGTENPNAEVIERFAKLLSEYASAYTEAAAESQSAIYRDKRARIRFVGNLIRPMMGNPVREEARAFGEMLFCDDVLELRLQPVAARWDEEELRRNRFFNKLLIRLNLKPDILRESAWPEGSIAVLGIRTAENIRQERLYKRLMYLRKAVGK
ncbi:MAG: hypothetical protein NC312_09080 [Bacteroides fragilis]|nr:hypothetical protein [Bacteroides fragilis]